MIVEVAPKKPAGRVRVPSSKSCAHRLIICAALCASPTRIIIDRYSDDIDATLGCVGALGCSYEKYDEGILLTPGSGAATGDFDCNESGSTLRFMLPVAAALNGGSFSGSGRLPDRPLAALTDTLTAHGAGFSGSKLPFSVSGGLAPGEFFLPGDISSQFISGLLFALPLLSGDSRITLSTPLASAGYVDLTLAALKDFGIIIEPDAYGYRVPGRQSYTSPGQIVCEGDWSSAAFWLAANLLGGDVTVTGLNPQSAQRDRLSEEILNRLKGDGRLTVECNDIPDLVPVLAVAAASRKNDTVFTGTARLRIKESDRVQSVIELLAALGGEVHADEDSLTVTGTGGLRGGIVESYGDHRIVMAAATAAAECSAPVIIRGAQSVRKSYPDFFSDLERLGGEYHEIDLR